MKVELSPGHLYFSTQQEEDGEELSEVDACTVAQAKAEEKLSIVTTGQTHQKLNRRPR